MRDSDGVIEADVIYTLAAFQKRLGWKDRAIRSARREGLKLHYFAGRAYVDGNDFLEWLRQRPTSR